MSLPLNSPSRKGLAVLGAVALAAGTLSACGGSTNSAASGGGSGSQSGKSLTMVTYGGETEAALTKAIADPFSQATGAKVVQDSPLDYAKIKAQQQAGNVSWDAVTSEPFVTAGQCGTTYQPLKGVDRTRIDKRFISDNCSVPADVYSAVILYDKKKFQNNPPTSWKDFFDLSKYPGKRAVWNYVGGNALEAAALADGVAPDQLYPLDVNRAVNKLKSLGSNLGYYSSLAQGPEMLLNGQVSMVMSYNTRAYVAVNAAPDTVGVVWNQEILAWDAWAVPKGVKDASLDMKFLNYIAKPSTQLSIAKNYPYGATIRKPSYAGVSAGLKAFLPTSGNRLASAVVIDPKWYAKNFDRANTAFTSLQSG
jgi:putative spermidine/putrescine transport system substrate-binding protein